MDIMATQRSVFQLANIAGYTDLPDSAILAGDSAFAFLLMAIQADADFGVCSPELFYDEVQDGQTVPLHQSSRDGYNYQRKEMLYFPEIRSTLGNSGLPAASGGLQQLEYNLNQQTGVFNCSQAYYVQGGQYTPTNQGLVSVWSFGQRGRGLRTVAGSPSFSYVNNSSLTQDSPLGQTLWRKLKNNVRAPKCEIFLVNASGAPSWQANYTPNTGDNVQPNYGHEDGCWYTAVIVLGPTGTVEPPWPGYLGGAVLDGGVLWICCGRGVTNGQSLPYPTSPVDGYAYSSNDTVIYLPFWKATGQVQAGTQITLGPSVQNGATRIQRLQKSVTSGVASCAVTYWNGSNQVVGNNGTQNDGLLGIMAVCFRATAAYPATASSYFEFSGGEFAPGQPVTDTNLQNLNGNINFARLTPEGFLSTSLGNTAMVNAPTSSVDSYAYNRAELLYPWVLNDTGAISGDYAIRGIVLSIDPIVGEVHTRVDYYKGGNPQTTGNGSLSVLTMAYRKAETLLSGVSIIPTIGAPNPSPPSSTNEVPNGDFRLWSSITQQNQQFVGLPDLWNYITNTEDGYPTQQPAMPGGGPFSLGLDVGTAHGPADTQWMQAGSDFIAIWPGGTYDFKWLAAANPAITQGMLMRIHFRDVNFENDTYVQIFGGGAGSGTSPVGALPTTVTEFESQVIMPQNGDSYVYTVAWGALPIQGGPLTYQPAYCWIELGNNEPNVSSTVIFGLVSLICLAEDAISPINQSGTFTNPNMLSQSGTTTTILVAADTLQLPGNSTSPGRQVNYSAGSVNPGSYGTWYVYANDPKLAGGAVTYQATSTWSSLFTAPGIIFFGTITTVSGGGGSGGGGGTGGGRYPIYGG
jgi:hypothetical protein